MGWTVDHVGLLRVMYADGLSFSQMSRRFFQAGFVVSRNAVIGKASRLGLGDRKGGTNQPIERHKSIVRSTPAKRKPMPLPVQISEPPAPPLRIAMLELEMTHCHYPLWDDADPARQNFEHCGLPIEGEGPYCGPHARICFTKQTAKRYDISDAAKELAEIARNERILRVAG